MKNFQKTIYLQSKKEFDFIDLTNEIKDFIAKNDIQNGLVNIQCLHTSSAVLVNENEPLLLQDLQNHLEEVAPKNLTYNHDDIKRRVINVCDNECINGHSHCKAIHLPTSVTLNLIDGELQLGKWQSVFFVELDKSRERQVQILIIGE